MQIKYASEKHTPGQFLHLKLECVKREHVKEKRKHRRFFRYAVTYGIVCRGRERTRTGKPEGAAMEVYYVLKPARHLPVHRILGL